MSEPHSSGPRVAAEITQFGGWLWKVTKKLLWLLLFLPTALDLVVYVATYHRPPPLSALLERGLHPAVSLILLSIGLTLSAYLIHRDTQHALERLTAGPLQLRIRSRSAAIDSWLVSGGPARKLTISSSPLITLRATLYITNHTLNPTSFEAHLDSVNLCPGLSADIVIPHGEPRWTRPAIDRSRAGPIYPIRLVQFQTDRLHFRVRIDLPLPADDPLTALASVSQLSALCALIQPNHPEQSFTILYNADFVHSTVLQKLEHGIRDADNDQLRRNYSDLHARYTTALHTSPNTDDSPARGAN